MSRKKKPAWKQLWIYGVTFSWSYEQISVHKKKLHKQSCTKPHSNVGFKKACKLVAISFHFFLYLLVFFGSFEAEADIDIVWLELIVEVNNWIERLFMEIALIWDNSPQYQPQIQQFCEVCPIQAKMGQERVGVYALEGEFRPNMNRSHLS